MSNQEVVLITGASSGVGQSTARVLSQNGYQVFGTSRNPASAEAIPNVQMLPLDVRSDDSVLACVTEIVNQVNRIDVLVNNAAYELAGALEETSLEEAKAQFETNFFGVVRMVKAVLPLMRRQKRGQIINVSSLTGTSSIPFMGIYSASKFALEGYTEALRMEVKPFNIQVSLTEAGFLKTPMMDKRQASASTLKDYDPWRQRAFKAIRDYEQKAPGPELVAETVLKIISSKAPRLRYLIGPQAKSTSRLRWFLPEGLYERGKRSTFGLDKVGFKAESSMTHRQGAVDG
jgi:NAD(P)-dependent dehydrogenase (short-subunit alcohol dehydrogenase family)